MTINRNVASAASTASRFFLGARIKILLPMLYAQIAMLNLDTKTLLIEEYACIERRTPFSIREKAMGVFKY